MDIISSTQSESRCLLLCLLQCNESRDDYLSHGLLGVIQCQEASCFPVEAASSWRLSTSDRTGSESKSVTATQNVSTPLPPYPWCYCCPSSTQHTILQQHRPSPDLAPTSWPSSCSRGHSGALTHSDVCVECSFLLSRKTTRKAFAAQPQKESCTTQMLWPILVRDGGSTKMLDTSKSINTWTKNVHPIIICTSYPLRVMRGAGANPSWHWAGGGVHHGPAARASWIHTYSQFRVSN